MAETSIHVEDTPPDDTGAEVLGEAAVAAAALSGAAAATAADAQADAEDAEALAENAAQSASDAHARVDERPTRDEVGALIDEKLDQGFAKLADVLAARSVETPPAPEEPPKKDEPPASVKPKKKKGVTGWAQRYLGVNDEDGSDD